MSINYSEALSPYARKGEVGQPEVYDPEDVLAEKINRLSEWIISSKCCVLHTGAGISTSAGIADFRGPNGVWTRERRNEPAVSVNFEVANPTLTHFAIVSLEQAGIVKFVITQNVDGLHVRSGFPLNRLAELHGNVFCEKCGNCGRGKLHDVTLDWMQPLPWDDYCQAVKFSRAADLSLCLGTSLQIQPANGLPLMAQKNGGRVVTVNLQRTRYENNVDLAIHAKVDVVMARLLENLKIKIDVMKIVDDAVPKSVHPLEEARKRRSTSRLSFDTSESTEEKKPIHS
ncbi:hypothetical protein AB6A40_005459 [Gnathostoma spinigerum]|uniref:protein acetyllysine N-acetyltransferase n=1 Tax=Gnathostoma spinigerum TaxID=75299 RepID=A0ABD6ER59_9BILA